MKKVLIVAIPIALFAILLATLPSFGFGRGHRHHGMMKDFIMYKIDKLAGDLNLNSVQQARWDTFKKDLESSIEQRKGKREEIHDIVKQELAKDNPDFTKVTPLVHGQIDSHAQFAHDLVNRVNELFSDLSPEQKKILSERIMEMHDHRD
ncbi:Spy/CpxP family protein refolding chaperone [bacterium]|nr:Spy/CpxP family protein refolding chaperone [bacterium]MCI0604441.1 Spy/CpxP family protein refolding chaperone [bacterium]